MQGARNILEARATVWKGSKPMSRFSNITLLNRVRYFIYHKGSEAKIIHIQSNCISGETSFHCYTCSQDLRERGALPRLLLVTRPLASFVRAAGEVTEAEVRGEAEVLPVASLFLPTLVMLPTTPLLALFTAFWCCKGCRSVRQPLRGLE